MTGAQDFISLLVALRSADPAEGIGTIRELGTRMRNEIAEDDPGLERAWAVFSEVLAHLEGAQMLLSADPIAAAVAGRRPDVVVRVGTDAAFACAMEQAASHIGKEYYDTEAGWIHAAAQLATTPERRAPVVALLAKSLTKMVAARVAGGSLVNSVAFGACARALIPLDPIEAVPALEEAMRFCVTKKCHYEAMQEAGAIAMALAAALAKESVTAVRAFLDRWQHIYPGERFMMEALYAQWLLEDDPAAARAFLEDAENTKGHAFAVAALADLNAKDAAPAIEARLATVTNPVTREAFTEGLLRLRTQIAPPSVVDRMALMFGLRSRTEQALGADSDDVFLQRARTRSGDGEVGRVTEVDDSADED